MDKYIKILKNIILGIAIGLFLFFTAIMVVYAAFNLLVEVIRILP